MKKALFFAALIAAGIVIAQDAAPASEAKSAEGKVDKAEAAHKMKMALGGFIMQPLPADAKYVTVVDTRKAKDDAAEKFIAKVMSMMHIASRIGEAGNGDVVIRLVDEGESIVSLDKPEATVVKGKDASATEEKLMAALIRIIGIDGAKFGPQVMGVAMSKSKTMGIAQARRTTYKKACEEGWAPEPKDEFQKAVWDKVKAQKEAVKTNKVEKADVPALPAAEAK